MNRTDAIKLVEELLELYANKNYGSAQMVAIYQRGYLTGVLADLIRLDFYAEHKIRQKIEERRKK
jgi:hypothetical protein